MTWLCTKTTKIFNKRNKWWIRKVSTKSNSKRCRTSTSTRTAGSRWTKTSPRRSRVQGRLTPPSTNRGLNGTNSSNNKPKTKILNKIQLLKTMKETGRFRPKNATTRWCERQFQGRLVSTRWLWSVAAANKNLLTLSWTQCCQNVRLKRKKKMTTQKMRISKKQPKVIKSKMKLTSKRKLLKHNNNGCSTIIPRQGAEITNCWMISTKTRIGLKNAPMRKISYRIKKTSKNRRILVVSNRSNKWVKLMALRGLHPINFKAISTIYARMLAKIF